MNVKLLYEDGSTSNAFTVRFANKPNRKDAEIIWNPLWSIREDGAVLDESGKVVGWFKLTKQRPQVTSANYQEDSLIIDYGTRSMELTDTSGEQVAKAVRE